jgi:hypothetical protein
MKSSLFQNSYCVFVDRKHSNHYNKELKKINEKGLGILNAKFNKELSCIVIPIHLNFQNIVKTLWENRVDGSGFWHQYGMGYEGKEWEIHT